MPIICLPYASPYLGIVVFIQLSFRYADVGKVVRVGQPLIDIEVEGGVKEETPEKGRVGICFDIISFISLS